MRGGLLRLGLAACLLAGSAAAAPPPGRDPADEAAFVLRTCLLRAAGLHGVPPSVLVMLALVEDGRLGMRSRNPNGTGDLGPMQVNEIWLPRVAAHWGVSQERAYRLLRDDLCSNVDAAAWILRQAMDGAGGDVWGGVARYHSANPALQRPYLMRVLGVAQRLLRASREPRP